MKELSKFEIFYVAIKSNRWYYFFSVFCRLSLAFAFVAAGFVKIVGERFASGLSVNHPMGAYLEALHHTGYYYTFIGVVQVIAAILLLITRTVALGALLYFPIIVNICVLSFAVRFEGSLLTAPLMVFANVFLLVWHYDKLRIILPINVRYDIETIRKPKKYSNKFPILFFSAVLVTVILTVLCTEFMYDIMPRNSLDDCKKQFENTDYESRGFEFCSCIHNDGRPLNTCLSDFEQWMENKKGG